MCHVSLISFGNTYLNSAHVRGLSVLEVGSYNVNGSLRDHVVSLDPACYVGVDVNQGPGVDVVCSGNDIEARFGKNSFNLIISTSMLEHTDDWRGVVRNMKSCLRIGGHLLLTVPSSGFPYHNHPDHWRFEMYDIGRIMADFESVVMTKDPQIPGVLYFGRKVSESTVDLDKIIVANVTPQ